MWQFKERRWQYMWLDPETQRIELCNQVQRSYRPTVLSAIDMNTFFGHAPMRLDNRYFSSAAVQL